MMILRLYCYAWYKLSVKRNMKHFMFKTELKRGIFYNRDDFFSRKIKYFHSFSKYVMSVYAFQSLYHYSQRTLHVWPLPVSSASPYAFPMLIHYLPLSFQFQTHSLLLQKLLYILFSAWNSCPSTLLMTESSSSSPPVLKQSFLFLHFTPLFSILAPAFFLQSIFLTGLLVLGCLPHQ